jgi:predicted phosphodiesterase
MEIPKDLKQQCVALYKDGAGRVEVSRFIMSETGLKKTAAKVRAKIIWDNEFTEPYVPIQQRGCSDEEFKNEEGGMKSGSAKFDQENEDKATAESRDSNVRTLEDLLEVCKVDLDYWEVERHVINKWEVAAKNSKGELNHSPLYQVKAWLKKRELKNAEEVIDYFKESLSEIRPKAQARNSGGKYMYEISIPDLHLAKLAWDKETGQDYDIDIAANLFRKAVQDLVSKVDLNDVEKILLPIGNDFFNSEGYSGATTAGTRQDDDSRWQKSFSVGCNLISEVVDEISKKVNVDIVIVQGNHDFERDYYLGEFLRAWYRNNEAVAINNSPKARKYVEFGENLILFTHGNEEKQTELPLLMATEHSSFSKCKFRTAHLGHLHQDWLREYKGVKVRILPSLCASDAWHKLKGYTGNRRSAMGFLYDPVYGEVANYYYNIV